MTCIQHYTAKSLKDREVTLMEWPRHLLSITQQRAVRITERQREWINEDRGRERSAVKGYFPTWWNQVGDLMLLSNACKPPQPSAGKQSTVNRVACCLCCFGFCILFCFFSQGLTHPILSSRPPHKLYAPLCSSAGLPKSLSPLFIFINPLTVPFLPPCAFSRVLCRLPVVVHLRAPFA